MPNLIIVNATVNPTTGAAASTSSEPAGLSASAASTQALVTALLTQASTVFNLDPTEWGAKPNQWTLETRIRSTPP